jgi:hypothetical protein
MAAILSALILNNCKITRKNHKSYSIIYHRDKTLVYYRTYLSYFDSYLQHRVFLRLKKFVRYRFYVPLYIVRQYYHEAF